MKKLYLYAITVVISMSVFINGAFGAACAPNKLNLAAYRQRGAHVMNLQSCLIKSGYYIKSGATGYYGKETARAVKEFYSDWYGKTTGNQIGQLGVKYLRKIVVQKTSDSFAIKKFSSQNEFKDYLKKSFAKSSYEKAILRQGVDLTLTAPATTDLTKEATVERASETNVQVKGIDEPDIIKTDGQNIYYSGENYNPIFIDDIGVGIERESKIQIPQSAKSNIIRAFPIDKLGLVGKIDKQGELLLLKEQKLLFILSNQEIASYDISDSSNPQKKWTIKLDNKTSLVTARLYQNKIYLIARNYINSTDPCPIQPLSVNETLVTIKCADIYHPIDIMPVDVTFTAMLIDPISGNVEKNVSFVGALTNSVVYMSGQSLFITYAYQVDELKLLNQFFKEKGNDLIPSDMLNKLTQLETYAISNSSKMNEIQVLLENYKNSLKGEELLKFETELDNRFSSFYNENKREFEKTGITKINLNDFSIAATKDIPGRPLNQFALDEYKDNLRIATTIGERGSNIWWLKGRSQTKSANDVYVLDKNLIMIGSIKDLGLTEKIYSVRFVGDRGYVVTFRQIDPFYVLDFSDPEKPTLKGELKIPGYSGYLEPIDETRILGVGQEQWQVKASLFDVSMAENPTELSKIILNEGWSETLNNHRAFLRDDKYNVFFLPAGSNGYVISYKNDKLELMKKITSNYATKRAVYINDYFYVLSDYKLMVFDENNWEKIKELDLTNN